MANISLLPILAACVIGLVALLVLALCRAAAQGDRIADWMLADRELAAEREQHYARCDAFATWDEQAPEITWPSGRAA